MARVAARPLQSLAETLQESIYCFAGTLEHKRSLHPGDRVLTIPGREEKEGTVEFGPLPS